MKTCRVCLTWTDAALVFAYTYRHAIMAIVVILICLPMWLYHTNRDNLLKTRILELESQVTACNDVRDLALSLENTPSGSRTAAGRTLARR